jgi:hypothetical protein
MSGPDEIGEFLADLARMDEPLIGLLDAYFHARDVAWLKLYRLGGLAAGGESPPAWSGWHETIPRRKQPELVESLADLIHDELARRHEAAAAVERARRATITAQDAEDLSDAELAAMRLVLNAAVDGDQSRWRLLAGLGGLWANGLRLSGWRKWGRIAEGPEEARAAASSALESEARRRGLGEASGPS